MPTKTSKKSTKAPAKPAEAPAPAPEPLADGSELAAQRAAATDMNAPRRIDDPRVATFARTADGRYGVVVEITEFDKEGLPAKFTLRTRDEHSELIVRDAKDVYPAEAGGR